MKYFLAVFAVDLCVAASVFLIACTLSMLNWQLVKESPGGRGYCCGSTNAMEWLRALPCTTHHAIIDKQDVSIRLPHCVFLCSLICLCIHGSGLLLLALAGAVIPGAMEWREMISAAVRIGIILAAAAGIASERIRQIRRDLEPQRILSQSVGAWILREYRTDQAAANDMLFLTSHLFQIAYSAGVWDGTVDVQPTPDGGREALLRLVSSLEGLQIQGASWLFQITAAQRGPYAKLVDRLAANEK